MRIKNKAFFACAVLSIAFCTSCDNTIKILAPYKNVTIVYGLLDQSDSVHYFRINKGFAGNANAYTMAQQYDSIYYPVASINAYLQDSNPNTNTVVNTYTLDTTTAIPLGAGTFSYPKQLLYRTNAVLNANDDYNLIILNKKTGQKLSGSTGVLSDIAVPGFFGSTFTISFNQQNPTKIDWQSAPNARIYQMTISLYFDEVNSSNVTTTKHVDWVFAPTISSSLYGGEPLEYSITAQGLFAVMLNEIHYEAGVTRYLDNYIITFTAGSDDLYTYVELSQPPSGINQDVPSFSDVKNGVGLYTARHVQTFNKGVDAVVADSIIMESRFAYLDFQAR